MDIVASGFYKTYVSEKLMYLPELVRKHALRRGFSIMTVKTYSQSLKQFFRFCAKDPIKVNKKDVNKYIDYLIEKGASANTVNVHVSALKFLYTQILQKRLLINIKFTKKPKKLPTVLSKKEITKLLDSIDNHSHRLMIMLMYSAGLRLNELICLRKQDIDFDRYQGWVRKGKGSKDRPFILAQKLIDPLKEHMATSEGYLFKGRLNGHISRTAVRQIIKIAAKKARIKKNVHPHTLRHSFATHLIENGYNIFAVQPVLGHEDMRSTHTYIHMISPRLYQVRSPLDSLDISV